MGYARSTPGHGTLQVRVIASALRQTCVTHFGPPHHQDRGAMDTTFSLERAASPERVKLPPPPGAPNHENSFEYEKKRRVAKLTPNGSRPPPAGKKQAEERPRLKKAGSAPVGQPARSTRSLSITSAGAETFRRGVDDSASRGKLRQDNLRGPPTASACALLTNETLNPRCAKPKEVG